MASEGGRGARAFANGLAFSVNDSSAFEVVRRNLHHHAVARNDTDKVLPHFAGDVRHHCVAVLKLNAKLCIRKCLNDITFYLDCFFFRHSPAIAPDCVDVVRQQRMSMTRGLT